MLLEVSRCLQYPQTLIPFSLANHIARVYAGRRRNFVGQHFWARGYWVSTVGKNEAAVRRYIQDQEKEDQRLEPLELAAL